MKHVMKFVSVFLAWMILCGVLVSCSSVVQGTSDNTLSTVPSASAVFSGSDDPSSESGVRTAVSTSQQPTESTADTTPFICPDVIDAEELKTNKYVRRLYELENDLYSFVFLNADGNSTLRVFDHPVKFSDKKGEIKDISLNISRREDGSLGSEAHMIDASFGASLSLGVGLSYGETNIRMTYASASENDATAYLSGNSKTVFYPADDLTTISYALTYAGIKEDITVSSYTGQAEYEFVLSTGGLHPVCENGFVSLENDAGECKATVGEVRVFTADEKNNAAGELRIETVSENSTYKFTIVLDPDYLRDEKTKYPITIDPSIEVNYDTEGAGAIEDVTVNSAAPSNGSAGSLFVGKSYGFGISRILMRFPNLEENLRPIAFVDDILSASVELRDQGCETDTMDVYCYLYTGDYWTESTAGWNANDPDTFDELQDVAAVSYGNGSLLSPVHRYSFDVTSAARIWKLGEHDPALGLLFKASPIIESSSVGQTKVFASYNCFRYKPSLSVTFRSYSVNYDYKYAENVPVTCTYRQTLSLTYGQTVTLSTGKATSYGDTDTVLHLFKADDPSGGASWANDDYNNTDYSRISITVPATGDYELLVHSFDCSAGRCNIYKDGVLLAENALLGGSKLTADPFFTGVRNFFTANSSDADTILYVMDTSHRVIAYNDDFIYAPDAVGDHNWGTDSRVHANIPVSPWYVFVANKTAGTTGTTDIYVGCKDDSEIYPSHQDLDAIDSIESAACSSGYNCIAWSGGITFGFIQPFRENDQSNSLSPWYDYDPDTAFDRFYGNEPLRYYGATTYENTLAASESVIDLYCHSTLGYSHAAVKKPGNGMPHGYDWESKTGVGSPRIFHPRYALEGQDYGSVSRYYKISESDAGTGISCEESIRRGLTVLNDVALTGGEIRMLEKYKSEDTYELLLEFFRTYSQWSDRINSEKTLMNGGADAWKQTPEFARLSKLVDENPVLTLAVMDLYRQKTDFLSETLFCATVVTRNEKTLALADAVREANNEISRKSLEGPAYIAPSFKANAITFIKEFLKDPTGYAGIDELVFSADVVRKNHLLHTFASSASVDFYLLLGQISDEEESTYTTLFDNWIAQKEVQTFLSLEQCLSIPEGAELVRLLKSDVKFRCRLIKDHFETGDDRERGSHEPFLTFLFFGEISSGRARTLITQTGDNQNRAFLKICSDPVEYLRLY